MKSNTVAHFGAFIPLKQFLRLKKLKKKTGISMSRYAREALELVLKKNKM